MRALRLALLAAACCTGCGPEPPPALPSPLKQRGTVDGSLPPAQREKQSVLKNVLDNLEAGTPYKKLKEINTNVRLTETSEAFMDGTIGLSRWDFNGKPERDDVPVVLFLLENGPDDPERRVERVYTVTGSSGQYVISRKR